MTILLIMGWDGMGQLVSIHRAGRKIYWEGERGRVHSFQSYCHVLREQKQSFYI